MPSGLKHSGEQHILTILGGLVDDQGQLDFALPELAPRAGLSERQVQRLLHRLHEQGKIDFQKGNGRGKKSHLLLVREKGDILPLVAPVEKGDISPDENVTLSEMSPFSPSEKGDIPSEEKRVTFPPPLAVPDARKGDILPPPERVTFPASEAYSGPGPDQDLEIQDPKGSAGMSPFSKNVTLSDSKRMSPFSKSTPPAPTPPLSCSVTQLYRIAGPLRDPRYVWVGGQVNPSIGALANPWNAPRELTEAVETGQQSTHALQAYVLARPDLVAALPSLRGKQLVYDKAFDELWAWALADLAIRPDEELRKRLPPHASLAETPPTPENQIRQAGGVPRFATTGVVHGADRADVQTTWCGQDNAKMSGVAWTSASAPRLCQKCQKHITGEMEPHVAIIFAWHESIPDDLRPSGKPNIERNSRVAAAMANDRIAPDDVRAFMKERYASYVVWARKNGLPAVMKLEHVRDYIKDWKAGQNGHGKTEVPKREVKDYTRLPQHVIDRNEAFRRSMQDQARSSQPPAERKKDDQ